jgi:hypothetical protein
MWPALRPLLCNGAVNASKNREAVFSAWSVPRSYLEHNWRYRAVQGSVVER